MDTITVEQLPPPVKPGYKTSEFWLSLIAALISYANESGFLGQKLDTPSIMMIAGIVVTYAVTRSVPKTLAVFLHRPDSKTLND